MNQPLTQSHGSLRLPTALPLTARPDWLLAVVCVLTIAIGLCVDQWLAAPYGQWVVNGVVFVVFAWVLRRHWHGHHVLYFHGQQATGWAAITPLLWCLVLATAGEVFLSIVWGLYTYRQENLPLFVPPGHVLLYLVGLQCARWLVARDEAADSQGWALTGSRMTWGLAAAAVKLTLIVALFWGDTFSAALLVLFVLAIAQPVSKTQPHGRALYVCMFWLALIMELQGTALGNWQWHAAVEHTPLRTLNPPVAAGAFYCCLDVLVSLLSRQKPTR